MSSPPTAKRVKLEELEIPTTLCVLKDNGDGEHIADENSCSICLQLIVDRTVIPKCSHEFCFDCLLVWTEQSRRCPLCSQPVEQYLIHSIRSRYDYRKHYLLPLRTSPPPSRPAQNNAILQSTRNYARRRRREQEWGTRFRENDEQDKLERSIAKRRWIYRHDLYAKHVASNAFTKYRPYPTPPQFSASHELISRTTTFLRRELQVWEGLDVEFLTTLILSLMKAIDIRSESAVKLIAEFLDMDAPCTEGARRVNAEHFAHEVYCYVRSPYKDLFVYDTVVQYECPGGVSPPPDVARNRRWHQPPAIPVNRDLSPPFEEDRHRRARAISRSSERSISWSPSGRRYSPPTQPNNFRHPSTNIGNKRSPPHCSKSPQPQNKGYGHPSRDVPMPTDWRESACDDGHFREASSSGSRVSPPSLEKEDPFLAQHFDVKGKRKVSGMELISLDAEPAVSGLEAVGGTPIFAQVTQIPYPQETLSSSKVPPRPPRTKSLLESVKAHLGGNSGPFGATSRNRHQKVSHDPDRLSQEDEAMTGETTLHADEPSKQSISTHLSQNRSNQNSITRTNDTVLASDIVLSRRSPPLPSSILPPMCIDEEASAAGTSGIKNETGPDVNDTHPSLNPRNLAVDQWTATTSVDEGVGQHVLPAKDSNLRAAGLVRHKSDLELRTMLLTRLDLEKTQAALLWKPSEPEEISRSADVQGAYVTTDTNQNGVNSSVGTSTKGGRDRVFDLPPVREGSMSVSLRSHDHGRSDPDSASVSVAQESRAREAKLRTRAQLRVRLAAEKRQISGG